MPSAREYADRLADLLSHERSARCEFLLALADFDRRKLWEALGHTGLFPFLHRELSLACNRHNDLAARIVFGEEFMERCKRRGREAPP